MMRRIGIGALSYLIPTFALGFVWHLIAFKGYYDALGMYRHDVIIPFTTLAVAAKNVMTAVPDYLLTALALQSPCRCAACARSGSVTIEGLREEPRPSPPNRGAMLSG